MQGARVTIRTVIQFFSELSDQVRLAHRRPPASSQNSHCHARGKKTRQLSCAALPRQCPTRPTIERRHRGGTASRLPRSTQLASRGKFLSRSRGSSFRVTSTHSSYTVMIIETQRERGAPTPATQSIGQTGSVGSAARVAPQSAAQGPAERIHCAIVVGSSFAFLERKIRPKRKLVVIAINRKLNKPKQILLETCGPSSRVFSWSGTRVPSTVGQGSAHACESPLDRR